MYGQGEWNYDVRPEDHIKVLESQIKKLFDRNAALSHENDQLRKANTQLNGVTKYDAMKISHLTRELQNAKIMMDTLRHHAACWVELMHTANEMPEAQRAMMAKLVDEIERRAMQKAGGK